MPGPVQHLPAWPHSELREVLPDVFFVTGSMRFPGPIPVFGSRNMVVVRQGASLVIVNSVRLGDEGLARLDALGRVEHVVRLGGFHGADDAFYRERYGATVWAVRGHKYARGFSPDPPDKDLYMTPDRVMDAGSEPPIRGASLYLFPSCKPGEGLLRLPGEGGTLISGDSLQNWGPDAYFNWAGRLAFRMFGFFRPYNVGPGWRAQTKPDPAELRGILDLAFENVLPTHGTPVIGNARELYAPAVRAAAGA